MIHCGVPCWWYLLSGRASGQLYPFQFFCWGNRPLTLALVLLFLVPRLVFVLLYVSSSFFPG